MNIHARFMHIWSYEITLKYNLKYEQDRSYKAKSVYKQILKPTRRTVNGKVELLDSTYEYSSNTLIRH